MHWLFISGRRDAREFGRSVFAAGMNGFLEVVTQNHLDQKLDELAANEGPRHANAALLLIST